MLYYPALLNINRKTCCVVGGGQIAERKARSLLKAGARVVVVSPALNAGLARLAGARNIVWKRSRYRRRFLRGCCLVIAATDDQQINRAVSHDAAAAGLLANIVDVPALSSFIVPAVAHKDGLIITVSTSGMAPGLSRRIKKDLEENSMGRYARALKVVKAARSKLKKECAGFCQRKKKLAALADSLL